ncbi:MAG: hypothetical protein Q8778_02645, partial [Sweet potato little leaf phytoplasma]|nr:hypothetical protein [Sweet potato little leaf phytoplasma]
MYARDGFSALNFLIVCRKKNDNQVKSLINAFDCEKLISSCGGLWELVSLIEAIASHKKVILAPTIGRFVLK